MSRLRHRIGGGVLGFIGFMLSPLSWWNDLFVNIPLALAFAWMVSFVWRGGFELALIIGYWLTNVLGFVLLHKGVNEMLAAEPKRYRRGDLAKDAFISLLYTGLIVVLLKLKVLAPVSDYFKDIHPQ